VHIPAPKCGVSKENRRSNSQAKQSFAGVLWKRRVQQKPKVFEVLENATFSTLHVFHKRIDAQYHMRISKEAEVKQMLVDARYLFLTFMN